MKYAVNRLTLVLLAVGVCSLGCTPEDEPGPGISAKRATPKPVASNSPGKTGPDSLTAQIRTEPSPTAPPTPDPLPSWTKPTTPPLPSTIFLSPPPDTSETPGPDTNSSSDPGASTGSGTP